MALFIRASSNKLFLSSINNYHKKLLISSFKQNVTTPKCFLAVSSFNSLRDFGTLTPDFNQQNNAEYPLEEKKSNVGDPEVESLGSFDKLLLQRRWEAKKSVIIQVKSEKSYEDLYTYCQTFGLVRYFQHYSLGTSNSKDSYFIIEFEQPSSLQSLMQEATYINSNESVQTQSQMLWFREEQPQKAKPKGILKFGRSIFVPPLTNVTHCPNKPITPEYIRKLISSEGSVSEQMKLVYESIKLQDIDVRLRFLLANQIESTLSGLFPNLTVLPFGSSVNGFGKYNSDLDLALNARTKPESPTSRLVFHTKSDDRNILIRVLESIAGLMRTTIPGVFNVTSIPNARVPIVAYKHAYTGLDCDLSITNTTAVYMSELLYLFGEYNDKVRPLVYTIRLWALYVGITNSKSPGPWITNFSLTLLVLFYLQQKEILPSIDYLISNARKSDQRIADFTVNCTFLRDLKKWPRSKCSFLSLEELLYDFFQYYSDFDFANHALSLREGKHVNKPKVPYSGIFIYNPLETHLNVSRNVNAQETISFVSAVRGAAAVMAEGPFCYPNGLLDIFLERKVVLRLKKHEMNKREAPVNRTANIFKMLYPASDDSTEHNENNITNQKNKIDNMKRNRITNVNKINSSQNDYASDDDHNIKESR